jgi:hypothetical protein
MAGKEWVQYHTPDRMGCGIDECHTGEGFGLVTSRDWGVHVPVGDVAWVVGKKQDEDSPVYLGWWFIVDDVLPSLNRDFLYQFVGKQGESCDPIPVISGKRWSWYRELLGITGNVKFGLTEIKKRAVLSGLRAAAESVGCPLPP